MGAPPELRAFHDDRYKPTDIAVWSPLEPGAAPGKLADSNFAGLAEGEPVIWLSWRVEADREEAHWNRGFSTDVTRAMSMDPSIGLGKAITRYTTRSAGLLDEVLAFSRLQVLRAYEGWREELKGLGSAGSMGRPLPSDALPESWRLPLPFLAFLELCGAFDICQHAMPQGHCDTSVQGAVPIDAMIRYSELLHALINAARGDTELLPVEAEVIEDFLSFSERETGGGDEGPLIAAANLALESAQAMRRAMPAAGSEPVKVTTVSRAPVITALVEELIDASADADMFIPCSNEECGRLVDLRKRRRRPGPSQLTWCPDCRVRDVHKRHSERRKREQQ